MEHMKEQIYELFSSLSSIRIPKGTEHTIEYAKLLIMKEISEELKGISEELKGIRINIMNLR